MGHSDPFRGGGIRNAALDNLCINTIRFLSVDAIEKANSGHPGLPLGAAPMAYALWTECLSHNPLDPHWANRDRFVLSAGHGSMLLYSLLHLTGYDLPLDELQRFRQWGSRTPGHPERGLTPGVEVTTGPLGQGFGNGVGMAIAEAHLAARYNRPGLDIIDHYTYGLVSDGDLMEGVASEAASLAGHLQLGKLIFLYDSNRITLSASMHVSSSEDPAARFKAYGWHTLTVPDGNDPGAISTAIREARGERERPSLIVVNTQIGFGSPHKQGTFGVHGSPLGAAEVKLTKEALHWPGEPPFLIPEEALAHFRQAVERGRQAQEGWNQRLAQYEAQYPELAAELRGLLAGTLPAGWSEGIPSFPADAKGLATRVASGQVMQALKSALPGFLGGSADLDPSTNTALKDAGDFESPARAQGDLQGAVGEAWGYAGRNLHFGIREHAMGSILNGLAAHGGLLPFGATFLTFSDYLRPAIRLAALMQLQVVYVFTHDSVALGEDGPTHQSVEHLAALRAIPDLVVIRPGDANETAVAWKVAIQNRKGPVALILSRQNLATLDRAELAPAEGLERGAYILSDPPAGQAPQVILIATGSELGLIVAAREILEKEGVPIRLVSMPSWELFEQQSAEYRERVLPASIPARLAVEAGISQGWARYVGDRGATLSVDHFGASAPGPVLLREFGFTPENVRMRVLDLIARNGNTP